MKTKIINNQGQRITIADLDRRWPDAVAYAQGDNIDIHSDDEQFLSVLSCGQRILIWPDEESSVNDDGQHAIAEIVID